MDTDSHGFTRIKTGPFLIRVHPCASVANLFLPQTGNYPTVQ
jgi:hypothetical protein